MLNAFLKQAGLKPEESPNVIGSIYDEQPDTAVYQRVRKSDCASNDENAERVIVSVTSYHKRFAALARTLATLDCQERSGDYEVHVHLALEDVSRNAKYIKVFQDLEQHSRYIRFFYHQDNLLSYKKLVYSLQNFPDATIITADDDVLYSKNWLERLLNKHKQQPDCIICYRGHYLELNEGRFKKYTNIMFKRRSCKQPSLWLLPTGVSGVLYPPGSLDVSIALDQRAFMKIAPKSDDFWFKLASLSKKTQCVRVGEHNQQFPPVPFTQLSALTWSNAAFGVNDRVLQEIRNNYTDVFQVLAR